MKRWKIWTIIIVLVLIVIMISVGGKKDDKTIKIGFIGPLTGGAASYGDQYKAGVQFAAEDILKNGEFDGRKFQIIYEDDACDGKTAVSATQKLINIDKVDGIIGGFCSGETLAITDLLNQSNIPDITDGSNPEISTKTKMSFQIWPIDSYGGTIEANMVKKYNPSKVALLSANTAWAIGMSDIFAKEYGPVTMYEKFNEDQTDFKGLVAKVKDAKANALVINVQTPKTLLLLAKQLRDLGVTAQIYTAYNNSAEILSSPYLNGMRIVDSPIMENDSKHLLDRYKTKSGVDASIPFALSSGYDSLDLFIKAFTAEGANSNKIIKYLDNVRDYHGLSGTFSFINHQINGIDLPMKELANGKLMDIK